MLRGTCTRTLWGSFRFRWEFEDCWVARLEDEAGITCSNSISSSGPKICCCSQAGVLPASTYCSKGHVGDTPSGDPGGSQWQLLTSPKSVYQSALLSSDHKCHLLLNNLGSSQASCLHSLYLWNELSCVEGFKCPTGICSHPAASAVMQRWQ